MVKRIILALLALAVLGGGVGLYLYNKPHEDMQSAKAELAVDAAALYSEFAADETAAGAKYFNKPIAVRGTVREATKGEDGAVKVLLETGGEFVVLCELDPLSKHPRTDFAAGETVTMKGLCAGYSFDVQLSRCVEMK